MLSKIKLFFHHYGWMIFTGIFWTLLLLGISGVYQYPTSDNYFMLAHDKLIREHGFVDTEILRMHDGFDFIIPQWLFAMFFSFCVNTFGVTIGYKSAGIVVFGLFILSMYLLISILYKRNVKCYTYGLLLIATILLGFNGVRPYYITAATLLIEILLLEKHLQTHGTKYLVWIPVLSLLLINVHNSLWIAIFLVIACYIAEFAYESIRDKKIYRELRILLVITGVSGAVGLINPYGYKYISYIFHSMDSVEPLIPIIGELKSMLAAFKSPCVLITFVMLIYFLCNIRKVPLRTILLFLGFYISSVMYYRNLILFFTAGQLGMFYILKSKEDEISEKCYRNTKHIFTLLSVVFLSLFATMKVEFYSGRSFYKAVDKIADINQEQPAATTIFSNVSDAGSYATMLGYRPYMDGCAEIYGYSNNHKFDIADEFMEYASTIEGVQYLADKYQFDYLVLEDIYPEDVTPQGYELIEHFDTDSDNNKDLSIDLYQKIKQRGTSYVK